MRKFSPVIWRMWSTFEAFRRMGFRPDDVWALFDEVPSAFVKLDAQGRQFYVACGSDKTSRDELANEWKSFVTALGGGQLPDAELSKRWRASEAARESASLVAALVAKGFVMPVSVN